MIHATTATTSISTAHDTHFVDASAIVSKIPPTTAATTAHFQTSAFQLFGSSNKNPYPATNAAASTSGIAARNHRSRPGAFHNTATARRASSNATPITTASGLINSFGSTRSPNRKPAGNQNSRPASSCFVDYFLSASSATMMRTSSPTGPIISLMPKSL